MVDWSDCVSTYNLILGIDTTPTSYSLKTSISHKETIRIVRNGLAEASNIVHGDHADNLRKIRRSKALMVSFLILALHYIM